MSYTRNDAVRDVVVVGAGATGLNAALALARIGREVAIADAGQPRNAPATHMDGCLSRNGVAQAAGRTEVSASGC